MSVTVQFISGPMLPQMMVFFFSFQIPAVKDNKTTPGPKSTKRKVSEGNQETENSKNKVVWNFNVYVWVWFENHKVLLQSLIL